MRLVSTGKLLVATVFSLVFILGCLAVSNTALAVPRTFVSAPGVAVRTGPFGGTRVTTFPHAGFATFNRGFTPIAHAGFGAARLGVGGVRLATPPFGAVGIRGARVGVVGIGVPSYGYGGYYGGGYGYGYPVGVPYPVAVPAPVYYPQPAYDPYAAGVAGVSVTAVRAVGVNTGGYYGGYGGGCGNAGYIPPSFGGIALPTPYGY